MSAERAEDDILWAPPPQRRGPGVEVDFLWDLEGVAAQLDGHHFNHPPSAGRDPQDRLLEAKGYRVLRISQREMTSDPDALATRLHEAFDDAQTPTTPTQPS